MPLYHLFKLIYYCLVLSWCLILAWFCWVLTQTTLVENTGLNAEYPPPRRSALHSWADTCHSVHAPGGAVIFKMDTGVRPALQQAGAFGESTGSKNEGSLGESMIFGIRWEKNPKIWGLIGLKMRGHLVRARFFFIRWVKFGIRWEKNIKIYGVFGWEHMRL